MVDARLLSLPQMLCQGHVRVLRHAQDEGHGDDVVAKTVYKVKSPSSAKLRWLMPAYVCAGSPA